MATGIKKRLYKSTEYRIFTGVAAGIGDYLNASHTSMRILFILLALASGIGLALYLTLSILLPTEDEVKDQEDIQFYYQAINGVLKNELIESKIDSDTRVNIFSTQNIIALLIISLGVFALQFNIVPWELIPDNMRYSAIIITVGLGFVIKSLSKRK